MLRILLIIITILILGCAIQPEPVGAVNDATRCSGKPVEVGVTKKLLSFNELSRPGTCGIKPTKIIMHTTWGIEDADGLWEYFETSPEGRYASTQFVVGKDGKTIQMLELLEDKVEIGHAVSNYNSSSVSIELGHKGDYASKGQVPKAQYDAAIRLVQKLMDIYDIPVGRIEADTVNSGNKPGEGPIQTSSKGIFGHYQLTPVGPPDVRRSDPGENFLQEFREDLKRNTNTPDNAETPSDNNSDTPEGLTMISNCVITKVGDPKSSPSPPPDCGGTDGSGIRPPSNNNQPGKCGSAPPLSGGKTIEQEIKEKWDITLANFVTTSQRDQLTWIREVFYEVDCTGFLQDIRGTTIYSTGVPGGISRQLSCPKDGGVNVEYAEYSGSFNKGIIIHELTHVWQVCTERGERNKLGIPDAYNSEGGLTKYSRNECDIKVRYQLEDGTWYDNHVNEDHADTIALHLNPTIGELTCGDRAPNPYNSGDFPLHKKVAEEGTTR